MLARHCWGCVKVLYLACLSLNLAVKGPFHCPHCTSYLQKIGSKDNTLDANAMHIVYGGTGLNLTINKKCHSKWIASCIKWKDS